jgi:predicted ATPase
MHSALALHDGIMRSAMTSNGGRVFKSTGDALFAIFGRASDSLRAARDAQHELQEEPWSEAGELRVRMALHTGSGHERDGDFFGPPLNRCARLLDAAHGCQVLVSGTTQSLILTMLPEGIELRDLGEHRLRDLSESERVFQLVARGLVDQFPPIRTLSLRPNNLPIRLTSFVGRARDIDEIERVMASARLITLMGPAGAGKSSLALQVAGQQVGSFPDGVWMVELAPVSDSALVLSTIAAALGVRDQSQSSPELALADYLREKDLLLVIDNCEHLVAVVAAAVDGILRVCPGVHVLCTSREALNVPGEISWPVRPLSLPDVAETQTLRRLAETEAVQLFVERASTSMLSFELTEQTAPAVVEICTRLGGIPLAIELAAARLRMLSLQDIVARLGDRLALLQGKARTGLPWHRTMRGAIDWSYDLLTGPERAVFNRLSVFRGGCTLDAAEQVCAGGSVARRDVLDIVAQLVDKSLIQVERQDEARYRQLAILRDYGLERLAEHGDMADTCERHFEFHRILVEEGEEGLLGSEQARWLDRLESERENLLAALAWAGTHGDIQRGLQMGGSLWRFWYVRGHFSEGREQLDRLIASDSPASRTAARAKALHGSGTLAAYEGDYEASRSLLTESLEISRELGDLGAAAKAVNNLAYMTFMQEDYLAARPLYEESVAIKQQVGDKLGIANSLNNLGLVALELGDCGQAEALFRESLALARETGNKEYEAGALFNIGTVRLQQADHVAARAHYAEALTLQQALGDRNKVAETLRSLGLSYHEEGNVHRARQLYDESLEIHRELRNLHGASETLKNLGYLEIDLDDQVAARAYFADALAIQERIQFKRGIGHSLNGLGTIECARGFKDQARSFFGRSLRMGRDTGHRQLTIESLECYVCLAVDEGQHERALRVAGAEFAQRQECGLPLPDRRVKVLNERIGRACQVVDEELAEELWVQGRSMTLDEVIAFALDDLGLGDSNQGG